MTRLWPQGDPIQVELTMTGQPARLYWRAEWHEVIHLANRWRVDATWWSEPASREYWKLITDTGLLIVIYHDLANGNWLLSRLFD